MFRDWEQGKEGNIKKHQDRSDNIQRRYSIAWANATSSKLHQPSRTGSRRYHADPDITVPLLDCETFQPGSFGGGARMARAGGRLHVLTCTYQIEQLYFNSWAAVMVHYSKLSKDKIWQTKSHRKLVAFPCSSCISYSQLYSHYLQNKLPTSCCFSRNSILELIAFFHAFQFHRPVFFHTGVTLVWTGRKIQTCS